MDIVLYNNSYVTIVEGVLYNNKSHAAKVYIRNCYNLLCKEMTFESKYVVKCKKQKDESSNMHIFYQLQDTKHEQIWYIVIRHDAYSMMCCCCVNLELVPYRHMFTVMKYINVKEIPSGVILQRWTIDAQQQIWLNEDDFANEEQDEVCDGSK